MVAPKDVYRLIVRHGPQSRHTAVLPLQDYITLHPKLGKVRRLGLGTQGAERDAPPGILERGRLDFDDDPAGTLTWCFVTFLKRRSKRVRFFGTCRSVVGQVVFLMVWLASVQQLGMREFVSSRRVRRAGAHLGVPGTALDKVLVALDGHERVACWRGLDSVPRWRTAAPVACPSWYAVPPACYHC